MNKSILSLSLLLSLAACEKKVATTHPGAPAPTSSPRMGTIMDAARGFTAQEVLQKAKDSARASEERAKEVEKQFDAIDQ